MFQLSYGNRQQINIAYMCPVIQRVYKKVDPFKSKLTTTYGINLTALTNSNNQVMIRKNTKSCTHGNKI